MSGRLCTNCGCENRYPILLSGACRLCGGNLGGDYAEFRWWTSFANLFAMLGRVASRTRVAS